MWSYPVAFAVLWFLRARGRGVWRSLGAFFAGWLLAYLATVLLVWGIGLGLPLPGEGPEGFGSGVEGWLVQAVLVALPVGAALLAVQWLRRAPPRVGGEARAAAAAGAAALVPVPSASPSLDATAAETLRLLLAGLSDPRPDVRSDCAVLMARKFLPALDHEPDPVAGGFARALIEDIATRPRPPRDTAETQALARTVALYTRLTAGPAVSEKGPDRAGA